MKNKIYYFARSYHPYQKGGGPLIRVGAVNYLESLGWDVTVVLPNYDTKEVISDNNTIQIPFKHRYIQKMTSLLERIGIYEDYLDRWVDNAFLYLSDKVKREDILFATSGGELGMIKLASLLKKKIGCRFIANFHDPLNYGYMNGLRRDKKFHVGRERLHKKYLTNADLILTSSQYYADVLSEKFTDLSKRIKNNYFGYINKLEIEQYQKKSSKKLRIAYVGTMGHTQQPERLYHAYRALDDDEVEIYFIGNIDRYRPLQDIEKEGVHFINFMPHDAFLKFMSENIDVGFVSLSNDYFGACFPSKIYEYINLGLPMIGALPNGDGEDIINSKGYGIACHYDDRHCLMEGIKKFKDKNYLNGIRERILEDRDGWSMKKRILEVHKLLEELR